MAAKKYIAPEITLFYLEVEQGFAASQDSSNVDIGIGSWDEENSDYNIK